MRKYGHLTRHTMNRGCGGQGILSVSLLKGGASISTSKNYAAYNSRNIFEYITPSRALFLGLDALDFMDSKGSPDPKMKIRCCLHDDTLPEGSRITDEVSVYLPIGRFLVLAHDVLTGVCLKRKVAASKAGDDHPVYFEQYGGTRAAPVLSTRFALVNGMGNTANFAFLATSGPGKVTSTGGTQPVKREDVGPGAPEEKSVFINLPDDKLKEFFLIGKAYVEQFIALDLQSRLSTVRLQRETYRKGANKNA